MSTNPLDPALIRTLAEIMQDTGLTLLDIEVDDHSLRLERRPEPPAPAAIYTPTAPMAQPMAAAAMPDGTAASPATPDSHTRLTSPMVGTAYLQAEPSAPRFVSVGDQVREGQTVLIVEAMKVMNPIPAPCNGIVLSIDVNDNQPVEYGQVLMTLERSG